MDRCPLGGDHDFRFSIQANQESTAPWTVQVFIGQLFGRPCIPMLLVTGKAGRGSEARKERGIYAASASAVPGECARAATFGRCSGVNAALLPRLWRSVGKAAAPAPGAGNFSNHIGMHGSGVGAAQFLATTRHGIGRPGGTIENSPALRSRLENPGLEFRVYAVRAVCDQRAA